MTKERPIIFSGPMVRAILDGRKTQTRRIVKLPENLQKIWVDPGLGGGAYLKIQPVNQEIFHRFFCPYGGINDRLWVRESFADLRGQGFYERFFYKADTPASCYDDEVRKNLKIKWKPSIYMPRWASRILLEITGVRVERLQDISEGDAMAEGFSGRIDGLEFPSEQFRETWESLYGSKSWAKNPWVWVIEFQHIKKTVGAA